MKNETPQEFEVNVYAQDGSTSYDIKEIWEYRDLITLWIKRDWTANYKQSILGPTWALIQIIASSGVYSVIFGNLAGLAPNGVPVFIFYMSGQLIWNFFATALTDINHTFIYNIGIMSKIYFPRIILPIYYVFSSFIQFLIKSTIFLIIYIVYIVFGANISLQPTVLLLPLLVLYVGVLALGSGMLLSSYTTKFRDVSMFLNYIISLWMYCTPIIYDVAIIPEKLINLYMLNPMTSAVMIMRHAFLGGSLPELKYVVLAVVINAALFVFGIRRFRKTEKVFLDTI